MHNYPWHQAQWQTIEKSIYNNRLAHALLLTGQAGLGKKQFASDISASVLCQSPSAHQQACGQCNSCQLIESESHPDVLVVAAEAKGKAIKVDQIRHVSEVLNQSSQKAGYKVVIIESAESMNISASNALLKSLEEPAGKSLLILTTEGQLIPTITSRCSQINFSTPEKSLALKWLKQQTQNPKAEKALEYALGSPLMALNILEEENLKCYQQLLNDLVAYHMGKKNLVEVSQLWKDYVLSDVVRFLMVWASDLLKIRMGVDEHLSLQSIKEGYKKYWPQFTAQQLINYDKKLQRANKLAHSAIAFNPQLFVEDVIVI